MSAVISGGCCCAGCPSRCAWWSASPTGPITVQISFFQEIEWEVLPGGQTANLGYTSWTITATMTKRGTCCSGCPGNGTNWMRYGAETCQVTMSRVQHTYDFGNTHRICTENYPASCIGFPECPCTQSYPSCGTYNFTSGTLYDFVPVTNPADPQYPGYYVCGSTPCSSLNGDPEGSSGDFSNTIKLADPCAEWNCNGSYKQAMPGDCNCQPKTVSQLEWKLVGTTTTNYSATVSGSGAQAGICYYTPTGCGVLPAYPTWAGEVLTIYFGNDVCTGCEAPILVFNPGTHSSIVNSEELDRTMDPCCPDGYCGSVDCYQSTTTASPRCLPGFKVQGSGFKLDGMTFDNPLALVDFDLCMGLGGDVGTGVVSSPFGISATCCAPINKGVGTTYCEKYQIENSAEATGWSYNAYCACEKFVSCDQPLQFELNWYPNWLERFCLTRLFTVDIA